MPISGMGKTSSPPQAGSGYIAVVWIRETVRGRAACGVSDWLGEEFLILGSRRDPPRRRRAVGRSRAAGPERRSGGGLLAEFSDSLELPIRVADFPLGVGDVLGIDGLSADLVDDREEVMERADRG